MSVNRYYELIKKMIDEIYETQLENINKSANIITEAIMNDGSVFVFGATHAGMISEELFFRAGGLVPVNPIFAPGLVTNVRPASNTSKFEKLEGYGTIIIEGTEITDKDVLIVHSVSGRNPAPIEVAIGGKKVGARLIVLTNLKFSRGVKSRHSSGEKLYEIEPDVIIDNCGVPGDALVKVRGLEQRVASTSTITGCFIVNLIIIKVVENLIKKEIEPPVYVSANIDGSDTKNQEMINKYKNKIHYL